MSVNREEIAKVGLIQDLYNDLRQRIDDWTNLFLEETITGSTPSITAFPNVRYKCGEVATLSITPPASGSCEVFFTSGSTATLLTVPNTVKFPAWFDATSLETNTIYDIIITDGVYGAVMSWAS